MSHQLTFGPYCLKRSGRVLVKALQFQLHSGSYLEMRGDNGAGKTSLLRVLAGMASDEDKLASLGSTQAFYFAHQTGFRPELTVIKQLELSLQMLGVSSERVIQLKLLEDVGLLESKSLQVKVLSHGQWRRLALAVMMASERKLWLIDEPLNALDAQAQTLFAEMLQSHLNAGGMAIIATHQSLAEVFPKLRDFFGGELRVAAGHAHYTQNKTKAQLSSQFNSLARLLSPSDTFIWCLRRELALLHAKPLDLVWSAIFFAMVVSLFPLALGANSELLKSIASGVFWMSALLSVLMAAQRLFNEDYESGALVQVHSAKLSMTAFCAAKIVANWVCLVLPLVGLSYLLALLYHLPLNMMHQMAMSLVLGLFSLIALAALFSGLSLMARQAQIMMSLLAFPVFVPLLIFGVAATNQHGSDIISAPMWVMLSLALLFLLTVPFVTAKALKLALE